jgi:energy-coupling factor transporter ATP-binding protein EcfA2
MPAISEIAPRKGERALIIGGTRSGKSTLMDHFMQHIVKERPNVQILLLDTKPRFRTEVERYGPQNRFARDSSNHYKDWESGPVIPGSVRVDIHREKPLERFWRDDDRCRIAVAQTELPTERARLLEIADDWYNIRQRKSDRVLAVDELLDHYHRNSLSIRADRDVPLKVVRAGGERGFGGLYGAQRPKRVATTNCRGTIRTVSISSSLLGGHQIPMGHGNAFQYQPSRRRRGRLCFPRNPHKTWRKMRIRSHLPPCLV